MLAMLREVLDPENKVHILRSSKDASLAEYFNYSKSLGSTNMDEKGNVYVMIHDAGDATRGTWFEELGHALQFLKEGNIEISTDHTERCRREIEVAECLLENAKRFRLDENDRQYCYQSIEFYKQLQRKSK